MSCTHHGGGLRVSCMRHRGSKSPSGGLQLAHEAALSGLGEGLLAHRIPLRSSRSLTQGMGLSLALGLWDLPELCFSIPLRGEAQMKMAQSGV